MFLTRISFPSFFHFHFFLFFSFLFFSSLFSVKSFTKKAVAHVKKHVVDPAMTFIVPKIKSAGDWISENGKLCAKNLSGCLKATGKFLKKHVLDPAVNAFNNMIEFFKGLTSFNPRETIASFLRAAICGESGVKHKIAWGTSKNMNVAELELGFVDKAIADGMKRATEYAKENLNDPHFGKKRESCFCNIPCLLIQLTSPLNLFSCFFVFLFY